MGRLGLGDCWTARPGSSLCGPWADKRGLGKRCKHGGQTSQHAQEQRQDSAWKAKYLPTWPEGAQFWRSPCLPTPVLTPCLQPRPWWLQPRAWCLQLWARADSSWLPRTAPVCLATLRAALGPIPRTRAAKVAGMKTSKPSRAMEKGASRAKDLQSKACLRPI